MQSRIARLTGYPASGDTARRSPFKRYVEKLIEAERKKAAKR